MTIPGLVPTADLFLLAQAGGGGASGSFTPFLVELALIIAIFYFMMIRPQQKQRQRHEAALRALRRGDEVVTAGGIVGEVIHIRETGKETAKGMEDRVTIKSAESRLVVERRNIAKILGASTAAAADSAGKA